MLNFTRHMNSSMLPPSISKKAFWDISFDELDFEKSSLYVMEKVFNYGSWNDQVAILKYYSLPRIRQEIVQAAYLRKPVLSFLCTILELQKTDFSCYNKMRLNPLPWHY
ncbi:MAG: hypothetical protein Q8K66_03490 [Sediminibacterium sp.]|nr:hypothetical protein [Sediminibacterium sp.]